MASKSMASPALILLLAVVLMLAASAAHAQQAPASTPLLAPTPSQQSLCPNYLSDVQALETAARALVDKVEIMFVPKFMVILDSTLAELGLLHPGLEICLCTYNPQYLVSGMGPKIKCVGGNLIV